MVPTRQTYWIIKNSQPKKHPEPNKVDRGPSGTYSVDRLAQLATPKYQAVREDRTATKKKLFEYKLSPRINEMALPKRIHTKSAEEFKHRNLVSVAKEYKPSERIMQLAKPKRMMKKYTMSCFKAKQPVEKHTYTDVRRDQATRRAIRFSDRVEPIVLQYTPMQLYNTIKYDLSKRWCPKY